MAEPEISPSPELLPGERLVAEAEGVRLGWQWQTVLIWWLPGVIFIALAVVEFHSWLVAGALALFCIALFAFYASDREVRPRAGRRTYVLTDRRLLVLQPGGQRETSLSEIAATHMESAVADRAVATLSAAATIVLQLRTPGPKGGAAARPASAPSAAPPSSEPPSTQTSGSRPAMADGMIFVWQIACGGDEVDVYEDGRVRSGSETLRARLLASLTEPVDVSRSGSAGVAMVLSPGDRRYIVARMRRLLADEPDIEVRGIRFAGDEPAAEAEVS